MKKKKQEGFAFSEKKLKLADSCNMPNHIAIIMDGNRRWAKQQGLAAIEGHIAGSNNLITIIEAAIELKIQTLTVFAFSTENWQRSKEEIDYLMQLFESFLKEKKSFLQKHKVRLQVIGNITKLPQSIKKALQAAQKVVPQEACLTLVLAIGYGAKDEIVRAVGKILQDYDKKKITKKDICEKLFASYLDTKNFSDPDLVIRTSGEKRLSNFMLWQNSYAEIYFTDILWPDFSAKHLFIAVQDFQKRKRRRGGM